MTYNVGKIQKEERNDFYQAKYEYYALFMVRTVIIAFCIYILYFIGDCFVAGGFSYETLGGRMAILLPFAVYIVLSRKVRDYRIMVAATYIMIHIIVWCTNLLVYITKEPLVEVPSIMMMHLMFVCAGLGSPFNASVLGHLLLLADIGIADLFIQYENLGIMYLFNIPCVLSICFMHYMMEKVYVEQYSIRRQLQHLALHDQLTKVNNRNKLKELSNQQGELVAFPDMPVSMLLIDIDFFKQINDKYGHEAGDMVLVHLAKILRETVCETDYVIRWGGEEFLIILPECVVEQAAHIGEKLRKKTQDSDNGICPITISVGVATYNGGDYHEAIKKADEALYQAKSEGRNRTVVYNKNK